MIYYVKEKFGEYQIIQGKLQVKLELWLHLKTKMMRT